MIGWLEKEADASLVILSAAKDLFATSKRSALKSTAMRSFAALRMTWEIF